MTKIEVNIDNIKSCALISSSSEPIFTDDFIDQKLTRFNAEIPTLDHQQLLEIDLFKILSDPLTHLDTAEGGEGAELVYSAQPINVPAKNNTDAVAAAPKFDPTAALRKLKEKMKQTVHQPDTSRISIVTKNNDLDAYILIHAPSANYEKLKYEELLSLCQKNGITYNINSEFLTRLFLHPVYETPFILARGTPPIHGTDGYIELYFETEQKLIYEANESGRIDFKNLKLSSVAAADQLLCKIIDPILGINGTSVYGKTIAYPPLKPAHIMLGTNTYLSEDTKSVYAKCEGSIQYKNDTIEVVQELIVSNVDNGTGNLNFFGDVVVQGDVRTGFSVNAGGDITVYGNVECATLVAAGNIIIHRGMRGSGTSSASSSVKCGGKFISKFIEHTTVTAAGDIEAEAILNCLIFTESGIKLTGDRACIIGGSCSALKDITAKSIGNESYMDTKITINPLAAFRKEMIGIQAKLRDATDAKSHLSALFENLHSSTQSNHKILNALLQIVFLYARIDIGHKPLIAQLLEIEEKISSLVSPSIKVTDYIYPNVTITINGVDRKLIEPHTPCTIREAEGELVFITSL